MGLDQNAFAVDGNGEKNEIMYWRKHPNLQGWMEQLWVKKGRPGSTEDDFVFNCKDVELTLEDIEALEVAVHNGKLPQTTGFFFGSDSDKDYWERDLEFVQKSKELLASGLRVFYTSWW